MAKTRTKLCTSISADSPEEMAAKASHALSLGSDLVEFRVDRLSGGISLKEVESKLRRFSRKAVVAIRSPEEGGSFQGKEEERLGMIARLAAMRPAYVDIELSAAKANEAWLRSLPRGTKRIISWHDFRSTPNVATLLSTCKEALKYGQVVKIATMATSVEDNLSTLEVCGKRPGRVVAFCMGEMGVVSRVLSMRMKAPLAYASLPNDAVAPGQLSVSTMRRLRSLVA